jgi:hypothetical protein
MSVVKKAAIRLIEGLPETCTFEDIQYHLYVREKIEASLEAVARGEVASDDDADRRIDEWLNSLGPNQP